MRILNTYSYRMTIAIFLIFGLVLAPIVPPTAMAADHEAGGAAGGVDVSGSSGKSSSSGKGALAPPSQKSPPRKTDPVKQAEEKKTPTDESTPVKQAEEQKTPTDESAPVKQAEEQKTPPGEPDPVKQAEKKRTPKAIGASAGKAGPATAEPSGGMSMGWKITAGVLGVGLLVGLAGSGGGGGGSTPAHPTP